MSTFFRYLISFSNDLWAIPLVVLINALWGQGLYMEGLCVCTKLSVDSWPMDPSHSLPFAGWYEKWGGTTFGHAIMYRPDPAASTVVHEHVHEHQMEAAMLKSCIVGLLVLLVTGKIWVSYSVWSFGYTLYLASNWLVAAVRGGEPYRDSVHEEHAYAVGDLYAHTKSSSNSSNR